MLARLIARSRDRSGPTVRQDDTITEDTITQDTVSQDAITQDAITQEWELARARATSDAELAEIDAIFGRHAA
jgi:hypothetical protein